MSITRSVSRTRSSVAAAAFAGCLVWVAGCGTDSSSSDGTDPAAAVTTAVSATDAPSASAAAEPITLTIATNDGEGGAMARPIAEFAEQVESASGGQIVIEPAWDSGPPDNQPTGEYLAWDQYVARRVVSGEFDMGMIPARAWDTEGVTTLRALYAPFLIDSTPVLEAVVADTELAAGLMEGLGSAGVTGLALLPESMRYVFSFGEPLTTPDDFAGGLIRAPRSATTYALFEALGASAGDANGAAFDEGVTDGSITGAESSLERAFSLPGARPTMSADVAPFANINSLVINTVAWEALSEAQQQILLQAAEATRAAMTSQLTDEAALASEFCAEMGDVVTSAPEEVEAMIAAAEPVYEDLRREPGTAALLDQIAAIKAETDTEVTPIAACTYVAAPTSTGEAAIPFGTYARTITQADAEAAGADPEFIESEIGAEGELDVAYEFTDDGQWSLWIDFCHCGDPERGDFGNYTFDDSGQLVVTSENTQSKGFSAYIEWTLNGDVLSMTSAIGESPEGEQRELDPIESLLTIGDYTLQP